MHGSARDAFVTFSWPWIASGHRSDSHARMQTIVCTLHVQSIGAPIWIAQHARMVTFSAPSAGHGSLRGTDQMRMRACRR